MHMSQPNESGETPGRTVPLLGAPTASGKSAAALELARRFPLEIVTADAMQVYRGMDIGTAKPSEQERLRVPHHLLDLVTPDQPFSVADWVIQAEEAIAQILKRRSVPLVVGGTGFYLQALSRGLPTVPAASPEVQEVLWLELETYGLDVLEAELAGASPVDAQRAQRNPRRVVRALEILRRTGRPPSDFPLRPPRFRYSMTVIEPSLDLLRPRIERRCREMFDAGLAHEVDVLLRTYPSRLTAMQAIGYKEVAEALAGGISMEEARQQVEQATVRYARRQLTWFRRQEADLRLPVLAHEAIPELEAWLETLVVPQRG
jgi:tRNA dimethylallyltransferase